MEKDGDMDACECFQEIYDEIVGQHPHMYLDGMAAVAAYMQTKVTYEFTCNRGWVYNDTKGGTQQP